LRAVVVLAALAVVLLPLVLPLHAAAQRDHLRALDGVDGLAADLADLLAARDERHVVAVEELDEAHEPEGDAQALDGRQRVQQQVHVRDAVHRGVRDDLQRAVHRLPQDAQQPELAPDSPYWGGRSGRSSFSSSFS
jgi:hypothetical protein